MLRFSEQGLCENRLRLRALLHWLRCSQLDVGRLRVSTEEGGLNPGSSSTASRRLGSSSQCVICFFVGFRNRFQCAGNRTSLFDASSWLLEMPVTIPSCWQHFSMNLQYKMTRAEKSRFVEYGRFGTAFRDRGSGSGWLLCMTPLASTWSRVRRDLGCGIPLLQADCR